MNPLFGNLGMTTQFQPPAQPSMQLPNYSAAAPKDFGSRFKAALPDILMGIGTSLATNNWGNAGKFAAESRQRREKEGEQAKAQNATVQWLASRGREDLAGLVAQGALPAMQAIQEASKPAPDRKTFTQDGVVYDMGTMQPLLPNVKSKAQMEAEEAQKQQQLEQGNAATASDIVVTAASRARDAASKRQLGGFGQQIVEWNPYSDSAEVRRQVDVLKSNAKVENLNAMRRASPTGGALGSVTEKEAVMLAEKSGALDPSSPYFERDLDDYERTMLRVIHGNQEGDRIFEETRVRKQKEAAPVRRKYNPQTGELE